MREGREPGTGRFTAGNAVHLDGGRRAQAAAADKLRTALLQSVSPADIRAVAAALVRKARGGSVSAAALLFDRLLGKVAVPIDLHLNDATSPADMAEDELIAAFTAAGLALPPGVAARAEDRRRARGIIDGTAREVPAQTPTAAGPDGTATNAGGDAVREAVGSQQKRES